MNKRILTTLALLGALSLADPAFSARVVDTPDFSGVWLLRTDLSQYGKNYPAPKSNINIVEQTASTLTLTALEIAADGAERRGVVRYSLAGEETTNEVLGNPLKATAHWQGAELLIKTWGEFNGNPIKLDDRWSLSADGLALTVARHFSGAGGVQAEQRIRYSRVATPVKHAGVPAGFHAVTPELMVRDGARAVAFYQRAFAAEEISRTPARDGKRVAFAQLRIGDSIILVSEDVSPRGKLPANAANRTLHIYTADVDAAFQRAVTAGAKVTLSLQDTSWGDRYGRVVDPFGHHWSLARRK